ncbi:MAG: hypothetical protein BWY71_00026 [Planctomycetes bacterium ADurb.Bin412]|nr:MAG: hypothetical protein BWY71_00026 [Planctomycetes bacterium ADurb.Bin412]
MLEQAGQRHFLLVSAREIVNLLLGTLAANPQFFDPAGGLAILDGRADQTQAAQPGKAGQRRILRDREGQGQAFLFAVFAQDARTLPPALSRRGGAAVESQGDIPLLHRVQAEDAAQQFGSAGPHQAGYAEDFAAMQRKAGRLYFGGSKGMHRQNRLAPAALGAGIELAHGFTDHGGDDGFGRYFRYGPAEDRFAVPENRHLIGDLVHFLDKMGNVDYRMSLIFQGLENGE